MIQIIGGFEDFWLLYDKKTGKKKAEKLWAKLNHDQHEEIMRNLPLYVASTPDKQYRKNPTTYLHNDAWEDEVILPKNYIDVTEQERRQSAILDTSY